MSRFLAVILVVIILAVALRAAPAPKEKAQPPRDWDIALTAVGGDRFAEVKIKLTANAEKVTGWRMRTFGDGTVSKSQAHISAAAIEHLWKTVAKVNAMDLPDLEKRVLNVPDYTIGLAWGGKSRTIQVKGASKSAPHLELILAIEKCFDE